MPLFLTGFCNSLQPRMSRLSSLTRRCLCRRFLPEQRQKTLSRPSGSSPALRHKKKRPCGRLWRRVQDSNLCTVIHGDGLAIRCITTLPTLHWQATGLYLAYVLPAVNKFLSNGCISFVFIPQKPRPLSDAAFVPMPKICLF